MNMVEKENDLIGFAHKVIAFKMNVAKACKAKGLIPPTDKQISEYINGYGFHFEDFMADFTEHEGIFIHLKTPLEKFKAEIDSIQWGEKPTEEEILAFFNQHGNDIEMFCNQHTIKNMTPIERKVYLKTLEMLPIEGLVLLWNLFIEESALYGQDSRIYDLSNLEDNNFLDEHMNGGELKTISNMVTQNDTRYVQWFNLNDNSIKAKTDDNIKRTITAYWSEIFERIMIFPMCYEHIDGQQWGINYFEEVVWPIITKEVGIEICTETNEMKYCK